MFADVVSTYKTSNIHFEAGQLFSDPLIWLKFSGPWESIVGESSHDISYLFSVKKKSRYSSKVIIVSSQDHVMIHTLDTHPTRTMNSFNLGGNEPSKFKSTHRHTTWKNIPTSLLVNSARIVTRV